jgi:hypothetical protein
VLGAAPLLILDDAAVGEGRVGVTDESVALFTDLSCQESFVLARVRVRLCSPKTRCLLQTERGSASRVLRTTCPHAAVRARIGVVSAILNRHFARGSSVILMSALHDGLADGRWKPFAVSATVTLLVVAAHTGALDVVLLLAYQVQSLGG